MRLLHLQVMFFFVVYDLPVEWLVILPEVSRDGQYVHIFLMHLLVVSLLGRLGLVLGPFLEILDLTRMSLRFFGLLYPVTTLVSASFMVEDDLVSRSQFFLMMSLRAVKWGEYSVMRINGGFWVSLVGLVESARRLSLGWALVLSKALCKSSNG